MSLEREGATSTSHIPPEVLKGYPQEILKLAQDTAPEIEKIWRGLVAVKKTLLRENYEDTRECYKDAALRFFAAIGEENFAIIKKGHLEDNFLYYFGDVEKPLNERQLRRDFVGKLYQLLIHEHFPGELPEPSKAGKGYSVKKLFELHHAQV